MKKLISLLLVLTICLSLFVGSVHAAGTPELSVSSGTVKAGGSVLLKVSIKDNPGIASTLVYIYYDTDTFSVDPDDDISAAGKFASSGDVIGNTIALAKKKPDHLKSESKNLLILTELLLQLYPFLISL